MHEHLLRTLPESALACRALYDVPTGGYHLPLRAHNRRIALAEVAKMRAAYRELQFDCIEAPAADLLYSLVVNTRSSVVLETGTSRGFSTAHLASAVRFVAPERGRVITIDIGPTPEPFFGASALADSITAIHADSLSIDLSALLGRSRFDFMFFDSLHTYAHLSSELAHFVPLLKVGGLFALHDTLVYDDLGLVVLWMMANPAFEALSLPTHRVHSAGRRSPGVSVFRKIAEVAPGELLFPDLDGIVEGERECLQRPREIVARTGSLFLDRRYAAHDLKGPAPRLPASPALLDPRPGTESASDTVAPPDLSPGAVTAHLAAQAAAHAAARQSRAEPDARVSLHRLHEAAPELRAHEEEWWQVHGEAARAVSVEPGRVLPPWRQRWLDELRRALAGGGDIVRVGYGSAGIGAAIAARQWDLRSPGRTRRLPKADAYVFDRALYRLPAADIERLLDDVREQVRPGARVVLIEPVCFPGQVPDAKDLALNEAIDELVREGLQAIADRSPAWLRRRIDDARAASAQRWWGERPRGPSPLEQPFIGDEPAQLLRQRFGLDNFHVVESIRDSTSSLLAELRMLAEADADAAASIAERVMPRLDALERTLLRFPRLPDLAWYLSLAIATA